MPITCAGCNGNLERSEFTVNQWKKYGVGTSRCRVCVQELVEIDGGGFGAARSNGIHNSFRADFNFSRVDCRGGFKLVTVGRYTGGRRTGQSAVAKWFKPEYKSMADQFFTTDLEAVEKCLKILVSWNGSKFITDTIRLNKPSRLTKPNGGVQYLVEPYILNFRKFNSNTGWVAENADTNWVDVMQALSHYSYHVSSGQFLLCDLQGGLYRDGAILTDPIIMSRAREFGPTDLGPRGISTFFGRHRCGRFCRVDWRRPADQNVYHQMKEGSSLEYNPTVIPPKYAPTMWTFYDDSDDDGI